MNLITIYLGSSSMRIYGDTLELDSTIKTEFDNPLSATIDNILQISDIIIKDSLDIDTIVTKDDMIFSYDIVPISDVVILE